MPSTVTFLKLRMGSLNIDIETENTALIISMAQGVQLSLHDMTSDDDAGSICLLIPVGQVQSLIQASKNGQIWLEAATIGFDVAVDVHNRPYGWKSKGQKQIQFVKDQDVLTRRVPFIYEKGTRFG
jgi:hypothetical protein